MPLNRTIRPCLHCGKDLHLAPWEIRANRRFCGIGCSNSFHARPPELRFRAMVAVTVGCWEWTGARNRKGYGMFTVHQGRTVLAHRFAWELTNGPVPDSAALCHTCDNPACVNLSHLFIGTTADNNRDMISKGRHRFGETSHLARLTTADAERVLMLAKSGMTHKAIAAEYGVSRQTISDLVGGRTWKHLHR